MALIDPIEKDEIEKIAGFNKLEINRKFRLIMSKMNEIISAINMLAEPDSDEDESVLDIDEVDIDEDEEDTTDKKKSLIKKKK